MEHSILVYEEKDQDKAGHGKIHVCPTELNAQMGDSVRWLYNGGDGFSCRFRHGSPFQGHEVVKGEDGKTPFMTITNSGQYHYKVKDHQSKIDPIIIVDPSPSPSK